MNRKQLILILVAGALLGAAGWVIYQRQSSSWKTSGLAMGAKILADFPLNDVAQLTIKNSTNELNLVKKDDLWVVRERYDYPANFGEISDFIRKAWELKAVQSEQVGPSQLPRLELVEPGKATNAGTLVQFKDKSGNLIRSLLLGKKHMRKSNTPSQFGEEGWPDGRYVLALGGKTPSPVALISDALSNVEPKPDAWLNKDFFKVEKVRSISVVHPEPTNSWKLARETEAGEFKLSDAKEGEQLDSGKTSGMNSLLSWPSFVDVVSPEAQAEATGMDKPVVATVETFENLTYTVKVGKKLGEDNYHFNFTVAAALPKERTPGKDEKAEDKEKLDKEFKEKQTKLEEKLTQEKALGKWTYLVSKWTIDNLIKERKDLFADKKTDKKEAGKDEAKSGDGDASLVPGLSPDDDSKDMEEEEEGEKPQQ